MANKGGATQLPPLFFLFLALQLLLLVVASDAQPHRHAARRRSADDAAAAPTTTTHLHFYFHDTVSGKSPTAVRVVNPPDPGSMFGLVNVMDDPLTAGPEAGSAPVGRAQGLYMVADQARLGFMQAMTIVLTAGDHNGSTLVVLGRNCPMDDVRELPVVAGTGKFRFATGYALLRTHWMDLRTGDATVEYNVYVTH